MKDTLHTYKNSYFTLSLSFIKMRFCCYLVSYTDFVANLNPLPLWLTWSFCLEALKILLSTLRLNSFQSICFREIIRSWFPWVVGSLSMYRFPRCLIYWMFSGIIVLNIGSVLLFYSSRALLMLIPHFCGLVSISTTFFMTHLTSFFISFSFFWFFPIFL